MALGLGAWRRHLARELENDEGFTLVELLVVLAIIVLLVMLVAPQVIGYLGRARTDTARVQIENISSALDLYYLDMGAYPSTSDGLKNLWQDPGGSDSDWRGPYMKVKGELLDPWGTPYRYESPGKNGTYDLYSYGADGVAGGEGDDADVTNW